MSDGDPTIVTKLIDDFSSKGAGVRLTNSSVQIATRLHFDDSNSNNTTPVRKRKWDGKDSTDAEVLTGSIQVSTESPWENRRLRADLIEARARITNLEMRVGQLHSLRRELEMVFESEKESLLKQQERDRISIQELESKISLLRRRDSNVRQSDNESLKGLEQEKLNIERKYQNLQKENTELTSTLEEAKYNHQSVERKLSNQILDLKHSQSVLQSELCLEKENVRVLETRVSDLERGKLKLESLELQIQEYQNRISELENERETAKEASELALRQQQKLLRFPELEKECSRLNEDVCKLRESVQKKIMLEEEVTILRMRCASSEEKEKWAAQVENQNSSYISQLAEWQGLARDFCPQSEQDPVKAVRNLIGKLQETELVLTSAISEKESEARSCRQRQLQAELSQKKLQDDISQLKCTQEQLSNQLRRCNKKLALVTGERNSYRVQLDLYEKDLTVSQPQQNQQQTPNRISELEAFLQGYREMVDKLEADIAGMCGNGGQGGLSEQLRSSRKRIEELENERDALMARCDNLELQMEHRALKGDFNPGGTRILHFRQNPASVAQLNREDELVSLRAENSKLKERVRILQEGDRDDITCKVEHRITTSNTKELQDLQEQVKSADLLNQRLKEYFKRASQEFRDCVYQLFGWKVDRIQNRGAMFRLSSMYAESPSDHLLFQMGSDASMTLIETNFSSTLGDLISIHLSQQHSLPMFLSAVTMDLFSRQTVSIVGPSTGSFEPITLD